MIYYRNINSALESAHRPKVYIDFAHIFKSTFLDFLVHFVVLGNRLEKYSYFMLFNSTILSSVYTVLASNLKYILKPHS